MLSRKYYRAFAEILGTSRDKYEIQSKLERFFSEDNPKFDRYTFANAVRNAQATKIARVI